MNSQARPAARVAYHGTSRDQVGQVPGLQRIGVDTPRGRKHQQTRAFRYVFALQGPRDDLDVVETAIGARAYDNLVDLLARYLTDRFDVIDGVGAGNLRLKPSGLDLHDPVIHGVCIRRKPA